MMRCLLFSLAIAIPTLLLLPACSNDDGDDGIDRPDARVNPGTPDAASACANIAGSWAISGACGVDLCTFTQVGCGITQLSCVSGASSSSGSLSGSSFSYTGTSGGGLPATCSGTVVGNSMSGTCVVTGVGSCGFTGDRQ